MTFDYSSPRGHTAHGDLLEGELARRITSAHSSRFGRIAVVHLVDGAGAYTIALPAHLLRRYEHETSACSLVALRLDVVILRLPTTLYT